MKPQPTKRNVKFPRLMENVGEGRPLRWLRFHTASDFAATGRINFAVPVAHAPVAQGLEQSTHNALVVGSNPSRRKPKSLVAFTAAGDFFRFVAIGAAIGHSILESAAKNALRHEIPTTAPRFSASYLRVAAKLSRLRGAPDRGISRAKRRFSPKNFCENFRSPNPIPARQLRARAAHRDSIVTAISPFRANFAESQWQTTG